MFMALCGLCTSIMWGGIFNLAVEGLGKYTAAASGIFIELKLSEMYVTGYKAKLRKDTSYKGLWTVSFTLKEM